MAGQPKIYHRLRGIGFQADSTVRLYVGPDHVLQVMSNGFTETYKRFFFQDIQAISCQRTNIWHAWTAFWAAMTMVWAMGAANSGEWLPLTATLTACSLLVLLVHLRLGPSCACYIRTAVQTQRLPTLRRVRQASQVIAQLRALIIQTQGELSSEEVVARIDGRPAAPAVALEPAPESPPVQS